MTTPQETPASVVVREAAVGAGPLSDAQAFVRMLEDDQEIEQLLQAVRARHTMDTGGPAIQALLRALGTVEMLRMELRLCRNYITGGA